MQKSSKQAIADFKTLFERLSYSQDYSTTFSSFLDFALIQLAPHLTDAFKDEADRLERMYKVKDAETMAQLFMNWSIASDNDGDGFYDALGDLFMECVSFGRNGQFFTPQPICDMMAQLNYGEDLKPGQRVCDPACGSGRTLLSMGKLERRLKFYAADNDHTCVKMAVLNFLVNSMEGEVAWMNTLTMEHYKSYHIKNILFGTHYLPVLSITGAGQTHFIEPKQTVENPVEVQTPVVEKKEAIKPIIQAKPQQLTMAFD
jgi:type I restriction-modification system DNA methylase subunit